MAFNVDQIYKSILFMIRKNQAGGVSATDFFYTWNMEQSAYMSDLQGRFQRMSNGKDVNETGLIENETIMTKLAPFTKLTDPPLPVVNGVVTKPIDFSFALALRCNYVKIFRVEHDSIWALKQEVIDPPSIANDSYYYAEYGNTYKLFPKAVTEIYLDYLIAVPDIVWAYTLDGNNRQVYDPVNSVQPLWSSNSIIEITQRTLKTLGVSFKDQDFAGFGQSKITTGD